MKSNKNSFVFYETFESVIEELPEEMQLKFYKYITQYGLHGIEPEVNGIEKAIWTQIQFAIDQAQSRRKRAIENGNKGGRPVKTETENNQTITQNNPKETKKNLNVTQNNQSITETKPNNNLNVNVNDNVNVNVNDNVNTVGVPSEHNARKSARFVPPTVAEVEAYCFTRNNGISAQHFVDFYTARGWKLSNGLQCKDWQAMVRTWEQRNKSARGHPSGMAVDDSISPNKIIL